MAGSNVHLDEVSTSMATPNMALVKYWGKRDERLILPMNSSISITLGEEFNTKTSVKFTNSIGEDLFYINGDKQDLANKDIKERFNVIDIMRKMAGTEARAIVASENSFPTAAGLASSASGIAAMVFAADSALGLGLDAKGMSIVARRGSGSACRSLAGGFVKWERGIADDGSDSHIRQIAPASHWNEIIDIVAITSSSKKKVASRAGMKQTKENGILYKVRPEHAEIACDELEAAINEKDFEKLAMVTMRESNNLHAVMLDTYPPIIYLNDTSRAIISAITDLNGQEGKIIAAYTFDAGPNANIITLERNRKAAEEVLRGVEGISEIRATRVGDGPRMLGKNDSLVTNGLY